MYYKKKNVNKRLIIIISLIVVVVLAGLIFIITQILKNNVNNSKITDPMIQAIPEIKVKNLNEKDKDLQVVILKIEASIDDPEGIEYVLNENSQEKYTKLPAEVTIDKNGIYTFKAVAKNTKTKEAKIEVTQIKEASAREPYIPEGFKHKDDTTVEEGFIIEDKFGNEYVWIPVESGKLPLTPFNEANEFKDEESGLFNNSVSKNYGFYVARYEAGKNDDMSKYYVPVSKPDAEVWTQVNHPQARRMSQSVAKENGYSSTTYTGLLTGGAWRAILEWANEEKKGYSRSISMGGNYRNGIIKAGAGNDVVKNIYNLAGNVREWTEEIYLLDTRTDEEKKNGVTELTNRILRGGAGNIATFTPEYRTHAKRKSTDDYWGFRFILFVDKPSGDGNFRDEPKENQEEKNDNKEDNNENEIDKETKEKAGEIMQNLIKNLEKE